MAERNCILRALSGLALALVPLAAQVPKPQRQPKLSVRFAKLPLAFEPGTQHDFLARGPGYALRLQAGRAELALAGGGQVKIELAGARAAVGQPAQKLPSVTNEYFGDNSKLWRTGIPNYAEVRYAGVYPGVSVRYYGHQGELESDFVLAPGADASRVRLKIGGKLKLREGALEIPAGSSGNGAGITLGRPKIYQVIDGRRRAVAGGYVMRHGEVGFRLGVYDRSQPLVIDPTLTYSYLASGGFSTVLGGNVIASGLMSQQMGFGVTGNGDTVLVGLTNAANFPVTNGGSCGQIYQPTGNCYAQDVFVSEFNAAGTGLVFSTYFGSQAGTANMADAAATLDANGNIYVAGQTNATDLPVTSGVVQANAGQNYLAKFNPSGGLTYATYLGGSGMEVFTVAADAAGDAYVGGEDYIPDNDVVLDNPLPIPCAGTANGNICGNAGFIEELDPNAANYLYGTYLAEGDANVSTVYAMTVDGAGDIYVGGQTESIALPAVQAIQSTCPSTNFGGSACYGSGFLMELNPQLSGNGQILFSTYLGGTAPETSSKITALALDRASPPNLYAAGWIEGAGLPVTAGAFGQQLGYGISPTSAQNVYAAKIPVSNPSQPAYITYLGGTSSDTPEAIAADAVGDAWIAGITNSTDYPVTAPVLAACPGGASNCDNGFVSELDPAGSSLLFSTFIGGHGNPSDFVTGVGFDAGGNVYIGGLTSSPDFPTTAGAFQSACLETSGACMQFAAFAAKLAAEPAPAAPTVQFSVNGKPLGPGGYNFGNGFENFTNIAVITAINTSTSATLQFTKIYAQGPNFDWGTGGAPGNATACQGASLAPGTSCDFTVYWYAYQTGPDTAAVEVLDNANNGPPSPQIVPLSGNALSAAQATVTETGTNMGQVIQGTTAFETVTVTSTGNQPLNITGFAPSGSPDFTLGTAGTNPCPVTGTTLNAAFSSTDNSHYCEIEIIYTARGASNTPETATLSISDNSQSPSSPQTVVFTATTVPPEPSIQVNTGFTGQFMNFPTTAESAPSQTLPLTVQNDGPGALTIGSVAPSGPNAADFHLAYNRCTSPLSEFGECTLGVYFQPTTTSGESATLQVGSNDPVNPTLAISLTGAGATPLGPPANWPVLASVNNQVPPQPSTTSATTSALSVSGQFVAFTSGSYGGSAGNLPGPANGEGAGLYLRNTCNGATSNCTQSTQYIAFGPASGLDANGGVACANQQSTITEGATNPRIGGDGRFVAFNDDACPVNNTGGSQLEPGPVYLRDTQANGGAGTTTTVTNASGSALGSAFEMSEDARFFAYLINPGSGGQPEITETDTCQSDGTSVCATPQDVPVSLSNNGTPDGSLAGGLTRPALSPDGRYVAFASDWDDVNGVASNGNVQVYLRDTCLGVPAGTACTPATILVSQDATGAPGGGGNSGSPTNLNGSTFSGIAVSKGGRYVVFTSNAPNLPQPASGNGTHPQEVYLRDTVVGTTTLISVTANGSTPAGSALQPHISDDGRIVAFVDTGALIAGEPGNGFQGAAYTYDTCMSNGTPVSGCTTPGLQGVVSQETLAAGGTQDVVVSDSELAGSGAWVTYTGPTSGCTTCSQIWLNQSKAAGPITVAVPPSITTASLPNGVAGQVYPAITIATSGGAGAVTVSQSGGTLPPGLGIAGNAIAGTPTTSGVYAFSLVATDSTNEVSTPQSYTVTIACPAISVGAIYVVQVAGVTPVSVPATLNLTAGALTPAVQFLGVLPLDTNLPVVFSESGNLDGLVFDPATAQLSGTPALAGTFPFTVSVTGGGCMSTSATYTLVVAPPVMIALPQINETIHTTDSIGTPNTLISATILQPIQETVHTSDSIGSPNTLISATILQPIQETVHTSDSIGAPNTLISATILQPIQETVHTSDSIGSPNTLISATILQPIQETVQTTDALSPAPEACAVPAGVGIKLGGYLHLFGSAIYSQAVTLTNTSGSAIAGPIDYVLGGLTGATESGFRIGTGAKNPVPSGVTDFCAQPAGASYVTVPGPLAAGASVSLTLYFTNVSAIRYTPSVLTGGTP